MSAAQTVSRYLAVPRPMLIGSRWERASGETFTVEDPATATVIGSVYAGGTAEIDAAVRAARTAFSSRGWRRMTPADRAKRLWRLADLIELHADELGYLETLNQGMPLSLSALLGAAGPADAIRYYAGWCTKIEGATASLSMPDARRGDSFGPPFHAYTLREPLGVIGAITPWNVPMIMATAKIAPALAAGNTVVLKPAELTPLTALRLGELILEADFPPGVVNIVPGSGAVAGARLAAHPDVDKLMFTGSTATGRKVATMALGNLKKVALELGGKSPVLMFADADLDKAIPAAVEAVFMNSGQICFAGTRLYVERPIYDQVLSELARIARAMRVGPGLSADTELGPLISAAQLQSVLRHVDAGIQNGASLVTGGKRWGNTGHFMEPTILAVPGNDCPVARQEIFGPVLAVMPFEGLEEGIRLANDTDYGLAAGVFTRNLSTAHTVAAEVRAGSVWINCYAMLDEAMPAGGYRQSGWGRESGRVGIEEYTEVKSVVAGL